MLLRALGGTLSLGYKRAHLGARFSCLLPSLFCFHNCSLSALFLAISFRLERLTFDLLQDKICFNARELALDSSLRTSDGVGSCQTENEVTRVRSTEHDFNFTEWTTLIHRPCDERHVASHSCLALARHELPCTICLQGRGCSSRICVRFGLITKGTCFPLSRLIQSPAGLRQCRIRSVVCAHRPRNPRICRVQGLTGLTQLALDLVGIAGHNVTCGRKGRQDERREREACNDNEAVAGGRSHVSRIAAN
jgi:hypothetical protein